MRIDPQKAEDLKTNLKEIYEDTIRCVEKMEQAQK